MTRKGPVQQVVEPFSYFWIMSITYTQHTLEKLENLLKALDYRVRYEKGNFKTGSCLLEASKVIVVNKFSNLESRINSLIELVQQLDVSGDSIADEKQKQFFYLLKQTTLKL
jgi:hypothetical protein